MLGLCHLLTRVLRRHDSIQQEHFRSFAWEYSVHINNILLILLIL